MIALLDEQEAYLEIVHTFGYSADQVEAWRRFSVSTPVPLAEAVRSGQPVFIETDEALKHHYPELAQQRVSNDQALVALPLIIEGRALGVIGLSFIEAQAFSEGDRTFILSLARQCAQALERARLFEAERKARAQAEEAQQHLAFLAETKERNRLAQELHDNVAQALGYINLKLAVANTLLPEGKMEEIETNLRELKQVVDETYTDVREEIFNLRSEVLSGRGFLELLHNYVAKYKRFYKLDIQLLMEADETYFQFSAEVGPQIIRVIQEALINVRKHAQVDKAIIRLRQEQGQVRIIVEDQGEGFELSRASKSGESSFGLGIMRERAETVGGSLEIDSQPGQGTRIILTYPHNENVQST